jgi:type III secretion protein J
MVAFLLDTGRQWCLAAICMLMLSGCKVGLYSGLNEQEANEIVAALSAERISVHKERQEGNSWQIQVEESQLGAALEILRTHGLPQERFANLGDVFQKQGLVSTPSEERMRYIYAMSQELSQTLRSVDGVVTARVHVVVPASDPLSDKIRPSSAAVFIKHRPEVDIRLLTPTVKNLVAHSIEGLSHDQVSISLVEARNRPATNSSAASEQLWGILSTQSALILLILLLAGAVCLIVLPNLLRKRGIDWYTWMRRQVLRR